MRSIAQLFVKAPFGALKEHMDKSRECVELVGPMFEALVAADKEELERLAKQISKLEHRADVIKNEIRDTLPRTILLSMGRGDFLEVLAQQDSIPDVVEDISILLILRPVGIPEALRPMLFGLIEKVVKTFRKTYEVLGELQPVMDSAFSGPETKKIFELIDEVGVMEWECDKAQFSLVKATFELERELSPVDIFWLSKIFEKLGDIANFSEKTANRMRLMLYKK